MVHMFLIIDTIEMGSEVFIKDMLHFKNDRL